MRRFLLAFASLLPLAAVPAHAEEGGETPTAVQPVLVEGGQDELGPVLTASRSVLAGEALARVRAASLGETLAKTPGVQNSAFGPAAGRPEIRGQSGPRVALLVNGMPSRDASTLSGDHAAPIEPFLADRIVVSKGPASVLNGGQAIGGSVDVSDGRIPTRVPGQAFSGRAEISGGYNTGSAAMARLDGGQGEWAWHVDALYRDVPDLRIPSGSKDAACRTWKSLVSSTYVQTLCQVRLSNPTWVRDPATGLWVDGTPPERQVITDRNPGADGRLSGSGLTTKVVTLGGSRITADGYFGAAVQRYVSDYGVPGFAYITSSHPQPSPIGLQVRSTRFDVKGGLTPDALGVARIDFALARTEGDDREVIDGQAHTRLRTEADDLRIDVTHKPFAGFTGLVGVQASQRDLFTDGAKAYLPSVATREEAIYWAEQFAWRALTVKAGARAGRTRYDVDEGTIRPGRGLGSLAKDRDYSTTDLSGSVRYDVLKGLFVEARYDETERAPSLIELYANGDHFGILTEEQGDSRLKVERAKTTELGADFQRGRYRLTAAAYRTDYDNYLYLGNTGVSRTLPVREWRQGDTRIEGLEIEGSVAFRGTAAGDFVIGGFVDRVRSKPRFTLPDGYSPFTSKVTTADWDKEYFRRNLDGEYLPRMPVSRFGGDVSWSRGVWSASLGAVRYEAQDRVAKNEAPTAAYTLVDAHAAYGFAARGAEWEAFVDATNLLDDEARAHNSFLRYRAPMAGRAARLGLRARF